MEKEILKKAVVFFAAETKWNIRLSPNIKNTWSISLQVKALGVSRNGYYRWIYLEGEAYKEKSKIIKKIISISKK